MASPVISEGEGQGRLVLVMAAAALVLASVALLFTPHQVLALAPGLFILALVILGKAPSFGFFLIIFMVPFDETRDRFPPSRAQNTVAGGASVAYRREIWDRAGGFPEWLRYGSDPLFVEKVLRQRPRTAIARDAVLLWQIGPGLRDIARRQFKREWSRYTRSGRPVAAGWPCYVLMLAGALVLAMLLSWGWCIALAVLFLGVARQALKSFRAYRTWGTRPQGGWLTVVPLYFSIPRRKWSTRVFPTRSRYRQFWRTLPAFSFHPAALHPECRP